jgi:hypothetical protein
MHGTGHGSPPAGMGHGSAPGHTVFAPGALHGPGAPYSYSPAVGLGSANGSGSGMGFVEPYAGAAAAGMIAAGTGAAAAGLVMPTSGTIPAAVPGRYRQLGIDSDMSSMLSCASSVGEPLQPQRLPPATWPAEAMPSPTGSSSMHSAFAQDPTWFPGSESPHGEIDVQPRAQPSRPDLESSEGGATGAGAAAAGAAAVGAAALAAKAAASGMGQRAEQPAGDDQPVVRITLDAAGPRSSTNSRRRSRASKAGAAAAAAGQGVLEPPAQQGHKSAGGRKSNLGGLFGEHSNWLVKKMRSEVVVR